MSTATVGRALGMTVIGLQAHTVLIEAAVLSGLPQCTIVGLADTAVREARERLRASFSHIGIPWPRGRVTINLSPADLPKTGTGLDLGIAIALLNACTGMGLASDTVALGELGLDGTVRATPGVLPCVLAAQQAGYQSIIVPEANVAEAQLVPEIRVVGVAHLAQLAEHLGLAVYNPATVSSPPPASSLPEVASVGDMSDVCGQEIALRGAEIAAAGGHHLLMIGPPGVGKSMIAHRLPQVLPDLTTAQALEVAAIASIQGKTCSQLSYRPPLASPHHTSSLAALIGGGSGIARPGAITAAHHGVLFCDEFTEFAPRAIQALREPLETGSIELARSAARVRFPARFHLVAAANPCPCGKALDNPGACTCTANQLRTYRTRLGGPVRDRIDVVVQLQRPTRADIQRGPTTSTAHMRARISQARQRQLDRQDGLNSSLPGTWLRTHTKIPPAIAKMLENRLRAGQLSMRGMDRILRLSWTISDLDNRDQPSSDDLALAFSLRTMMEA